MLRSRHLRLIVTAMLAFAALATPQTVSSFPGDLDHSFGTDGLVTTRFGSDSINAVFALLVEPDGKLVAAGVEGPFDLHFAIARYDGDGFSDPTFGTGGLVTTDFPGLDFDGARAMARQSDGKLVVVGTSGGRIALARYEANGERLDSSFGSAGMVVTEIGGNETADAVALQPDGRIVIAGWSSGHAQTVVLARYDPDGTPDASFGLGGLVLTNFGSSDLAHAVAIQSDGKIVVGGEFLVPGSFNFDFEIIRYLSDGTVDVTFGTDGHVTTDFDGGSDRLTAMLLQPDGKFVTTGFTYPRGRTPFSFEPSDIVLARYDTSGAIDSAFGEGGRVVSDIAGGYDGAQALVLQTDGRIVIAGSADRTFVVARYLGDGATDFEFGSCGRVLTDFPGSGFQEDHAYALAQQADGKLIAAGATYNGTDETFALARYETIGPALCPALPSSTCTQSLKPTKSFLRIRDSSSDQLDTVSWALESGDVTLPQEFGDPYGHDAYALCVYDRPPAGSDRLVFGANAPPAERCGHPPCWKSTRRGEFTYRNSDATPCGLGAIRLRAGAAAKTRIVVRGSGPRLSLPRLPLSVPVHVQLHSTSGRCWETTLSDVRRSDRGRFAVRGE